MARYVELQVTSHFSFLRGASSPEQLFSAAALLGHKALGLADWGSVAGVVRGWDAQKATKVRMIAGARVDLTDGRALLLYPTGRPAWSRITRLLSVGKARGGKGCCLLDWADVTAHAEGQIAILVPDEPDSVTRAHLDDIRTVFGSRAHTLRPMTEGREVVEDYRSLQLSLRNHPLSFLRAQLDAMGIARCADLKSIRNGRNIEVAGVILVRQRPGSAKGVLFVTIEDETGVAQGILWPDRFEIYRRQVMSASMIAMRGRLQKEGEVIHIICDRIIDHDEMLRSVGRMDFNVAPGRGDGASHGGGPDPRDPAFPNGRTLGSPPYRNAPAAPDDILPIRSHDFH